MNIKNRKLLSRAVSVAALAIFSQSAYAAPFTFEGRSLGMGGVGVATADLATAAWANPAMLTNQHESDDFSLLVGIGAFGRDNDDLLSDIQDFQDADDRRNAAVQAGDTIGEVIALADMANIIPGIDSKNVAVDVSGVAAMGIAFETFAMAVSVRADAIGAGTVDNLSCQLDVDPGCDLATFQSELTSDQFNILSLEGVLATEVGVSFAKAFQLYDRKFSVGIKPKFVDIQGFSFQESIKTIDGINDINNSDNKTDIGTYTTIDLGLGYDVAESFRLGLNLTNLIPADFKVGAQTLNFDTGARFGAAYHNDFLTVGIDYDLIENKPLLANPRFGDLKTQYLSVGAELNAFDFAQLRVGASKNTASGINGSAGDVLYTAGVGFWLGFNLDLAATFADHSLGAFVQTGFRF